MTVKELIEILAVYPQDMPAVVWDTFSEINVDIESINYTDDRKSIEIVGEFY